MLCYLSHVVHSAAVFLSCLWPERHMLGEVVVPVLLKGQVSLLATRYFLTILQQINFDFRWMEAADVADKDVVFIILPWVAAVDLNLRCSFLGQDNLSCVENNEQ